MIAQVRNETIRAIFPLNKSKGCFELAHGKLSLKNANLDETLVDNFFGIVNTKCNELLDAIPKIHKFTRFVRVLFPVIILVGFSLLIADIATAPSRGSNNGASISALYFVGGGLMLCAVTALCITSVYAQCFLRNPLLRTLEAALKEIIEEENEIKYKQFNIEWRRSKPNLDWLELRIQVCSLEPEKSEVAAATEPETLRKPPETKESVPKPIKETTKEIIEPNNTKPEVKSRQVEVKSQKVEVKAKEEPLKTEIKKEVPKRALEEEIQRSITHDASISQIAITQNNQSQIITNRFNDSMLPLVTSFVKKERPKPKKEETGQKKTVRFFEGKGKQGDNEIKKWYSQSEYLF